jgi:hypothetical protein
MGVIAILLSLSVLGLGAYRVTRVLFGLPSGFPSVFGAFVLAWTWVTLGTLGLGLIGWLYRGPLLVWSVAVPLVATLILKRRPGAAPELVPSDGKSEWGPTVGLAFGLTFWAVISLFIPSLLLPVKVISDGPIYHLYFAARWWQAGRIFLVATPFGETAAPYFPAVGDMWLTWLFVVGGGDRLARVGQMPFLVVAALVVYALARQANVRPSAAALATCWFATVSPLLVFTVEPVVDTIFLAGYLLAFYCAARYVRGDDDTASLFLAGLAAGGAVGTKAPGIVFIPPLLGALAVVAVTRAGGFTRRARDIAVVFLSPLILGGYWFARNAWLTGNPLYPLEVTVFGRTVFPGWFGPRAMTSSRYYLAATDWRAGLDILLAVFDPRLFLVWLAAVAGMWRLGRPAGRGDRLAWACAFFAVFNVALYWLLIPYRTQQRFFLHSTALAAIPLAKLFDRAPAVRWAGVSLLAIHDLTPQDWPFATFLEHIPWDLSPHVPSRATSPVTFVGDIEGVVGASPGLSRSTALLLLVVGALCMVAGYWFSRAGRRTRWAYSVSFTILVLGGILQSLILVTRVNDPIYYRFPYFIDYLSGWADLDGRIGRSPTRIAYAGTNLPYYLMGRDFENDVRYVNVDGHPHWLLHDYHRAAASRGLPETWPTTRPGWDRIRPVYAEWIANLDAAGIQLLVVTKADPVEGKFNPFDSQGFPIERAFADAHPERFRPLYADPLFRLYALKPPGKKIARATDLPASSHQ